MEVEQASRKAGHSPSRQPGSLTEHFAMQHSLPLTLTTNSTTSDVDRKDLLNALSHTSIYQPNPAASSRNLNTHEYMILGSSSEDEGGQQKRQELATCCLLVLASSLVEGQAKLPRHKNKEDSDTTVQLASLSMSQRMQAATDVAFALARMHDEGRFHGSVTPDCVLLQAALKEGGPIRSTIRDFHATGLVVPGSVLAHTGPGRTCATASELDLDKATTFAQDVFSFGSVLVYLASGVRVAPALLRSGCEPQHQGAGKKHTSGPTDNQSCVDGDHVEIPESCPLELVIMARKCWAANTAHRPTAAWLVTHLDTLVVHLQIAEQSRSMCGLG